MTATQAQLPNELAPLMSGGLTTFVNYERKKPKGTRQNAASQLIKRTALCLKKSGTQGQVLRSLYDECANAERWDDAIYLATCLGQDHVRCYTTPYVPMLMWSDRSCETMLLLRCFEGPSCDHVLIERNFAENTH